MEAALKRAIDAHLRPKGFAGSLPHFRRRASDRIDLVSFQFHSAGGSFVVEVAGCDPDGYTTGWGKQIQPSKVTAHDIPMPRPRLGPGFPTNDHWFVFGPRSYEAGSADVRAAAHYESIAAEVIRLIDVQAEPFWQSAPSRS
jgi:hypothetical protein